MHNLRQYTILDNLSKSYDVRLFISVMRVYAYATH